MPLYEYDCEKCSGRFSLIQALGTTEADTVCPECGSDNVKKVVSAFSFGSAGGGFSLNSTPTGGG